MKDIVIVGDGGFAKEVEFLIKDLTSEYWHGDTKLTPWEFKGFVKDDFDSEVPINVVIGIGTPEARARVFEQLSVKENLLFPNLIHPNVVGDWDNIKLGKGNIICAGNIFTTDIEIGDNNLFNLGCTVGHDTKIGKNNVFNPSVNISGGVDIRDNILVGTGAQILQYLYININSTIGAGAVVTKDITDDGTYVGVPAKRINNA